VPTPEPGLIGTLVAPPEIPEVLGATWEFGSIAGCGTRVIERPVVMGDPVVIDDELPERTPLELGTPLGLVWASAKAELPLRAAAVSKAVS
jgi:hypothetical protein